MRDGNDGGRVLRSVREGMLLEDISRWLRLWNGCGRAVREVMAHDCSVRVVRFGRAENGVMLSSEPMGLEDRFRLVKYCVGRAGNGFDRLFAARERISKDGKSFSMLVI